MTKIANARRTARLVLFTALLGAQAPACQVGLGNAATPEPLPPAPKGTTRIDEELVVRTLAPDTYLIVHEPFVAANVLVAKMPDGTVLICSSPFETVASRALVAWVKKTLAPTRIVVINTHFHLDGTGGNEAYREAGAEIYASSLTQRLAKERGEAQKVESARLLTHDEEKKRMLAIAITPADHVWDEREDLTMKLGTEEVRIHYPGAGHSADNVVVYFPARSVLFGGCLVKGSRSVGFIGDADLDHWEAAIESVRAVGPARIVVPGHGEVGGPELLDLTIAVVRGAKSSPK